jgi:hypothetical protein
MNGTDLSLAYGGFSDASSFNNPYQNSQPQQQQQQQAAPNPDIGALPPPQISKGSQSHAMPPDAPYNPPAAMYAQQSPNAKPMYVPPSESFWDRIALKKWEVFKFFVMSLIVVLALSLDKLVTHYMTGYIGKSFLTENQELLVRFAYPASVVLLIWLLKATF